MKGKIFVISGPSGSGKTTLMERMLKERVLKNKLARSISFTTRRKRCGERNGKDYFFVSQGEFERLKKAKKILEWTKYLGYYYGTPKEFVEQQLAQGKHIILCLDSKGAAAIKKFFPKSTVSVFVIPPSIDVLHHRIRNRCNKTGAAEIRQRVNLAEKELKAASGYNYRLVNRDLGVVEKQLKKIILENT